MIRRRPIPRTRDYPEVSQHWDMSPDGSYRIYKDGREVCVDSPAGWRRRDDEHREFKRKKEPRYGKK
jgi:hypothetical protein